MRKRCGMSRLIDADALILYLNDYALQEAPTDYESTESQRTSEMVYRVIQNCIRAVEEQPTAYDIEKVVAELKGKKDEASIEAGKRSVRIGEDEYEEEPYYEGKKYAYGHAIELLRKGGVEYA